MSEYNDLREAVAQGPADGFRLIVTVFVLLVVTTTIAAIVLMFAIRIGMKNSPALRRLFAEILVLKNWNQRPVKWLNPNASEQFKRDVSNLQSSFNPSGTAIDPEHFDTRH